ncbi:MAG TPA: DUF937 domain-containing protein [Propionibacteriaceae bacterium]|nr:DUF937 domain-containing protein [Propionibacteriaceae bacterium]
MAAVDEILSTIPMEQLAQRLGVDQSEADAATRQAIPALLGGLQANAQDDAGAASLAGALSNHSGDLIDGGVDLNQVDSADGQKVVRNIFGSNTDQVVQTLGANAGGRQQLVEKLLPILAPIVLSYLAKHVGGGKYGNVLGSVLGGTIGGGAGSPLNDVLGGLLGQGSGRAPTDSGQDKGGVMDVLGGLLGGGRR